MNMSFHSSLQRSLVVIGSLVLLLPMELRGSPAVSKTHSIPGDFTTIADALASSAVVDGDTISVTPGTYSGAGFVDLDFNGKLVELTSSSGEPSSVILDCAGSASRAFIFQSGEDDRARVVGFKVVNGFAPGYGGAVSCRSGSAPTFVDCQFSRCSAGNGGGAIFITEESSPSFIGCNMQDNSSKTGGAVYASDFGRIEFRNCSLVGNRAEVTDGGAIHAESGDRVILRSCTFDINNAREDGGAVSLEQCGHVGIDYCRFASNANGDNSADQNGGALYGSACPDLQLYRTEFGTTIQGNPALGGSNIAGGSGGALYLFRSSATLDSCELINGVALGNHGGGAAVIETGYVMAGGKVEHNVANRYGGGLFIADHSDAQIDGTSFSSNGAWRGGGLSVVDSEDLTYLSLRNSSVDLCSVTDDGGGLYTDSPTDVRDCEFTGCLANFGNGSGGGALVAHDDVLFERTLFESCLANDKGGAVFNISADATFAECELHDNQAAYGGAIHNEDGSPTFDHCLIWDNVATSEGAGLYNSALLHRANPAIRDSRFLGNTAQFAGGGIANRSGGEISVVNVVFSRNVAGVGGAVGLGAGIYSIDAQTITTVLNCSFSSNNAVAGGGGGIFNGADSEMSIHNCLFWANVDATGMSESAQIDSHPSALPDITYTSLMNWVSIGGSGVDGRNPNFVDALNDDLHLGPNSAGIDSGDNTQVPEGVELDLDGLDRFQDVSSVPDSRGSGVGMIVDRGAFERSEPQACQNGIGYQGPGDMVMSLCGEDLTVPDNEATLLIEGAPADSPVVILIAFEPNPTPYRGGWMVPLPFVGMLQFRVDETGSLSLTVPGSGGPPVTFYLQAVVNEDDTADFSSTLEVTKGL